MMTYAEARLRLKNHANLPSELPIEDSISCSLYLGTKSGVLPAIEPLVVDVIECLKVINLHMNGPIPSESDKRIHERDCNGEITGIAYSITCIISRGMELLRLWSRKNQFTAEVHETLAEAIHRIAYAWEEVLAGDMDDILEGFQ